MRTDETTNVEVRLSLCVTVFLSRSRPRARLMYRFTFAGEYSCLKVDLLFKRQFSYYLIQIYIPCCMLVIVSWVSFWLDQGAVPARVSLGKLHSTYTERHLYDVTFRCDDTADDGNTNVWYKRILAACLLHKGHRCLDRSLPDVCVRCAFRIRPCQLRITFRYAQREHEEAKETVRTGTCSLDGRYVGFN